MPKPDVIYEKEFHFLDETLLKKEQRLQNEEVEGTEEKKAEVGQVENEVVEPKENVGSSEQEGQPVKKKGLLQNDTVTIQLTNQKDFSHDLAERSLSKIRNKDELL